MVTAILREISVGTATRWLDWPFTPIPKFDDRFEHQNRFELPPEFPLASPYSGIVHHLSGLNIYAPAQTFFSREDGWPSRQGLHPYRLFYFHYARGNTYPCTRIHVKLIGPCFKTGDKNEFCYSKT